MALTGRTGLTLRVTPELSRVVTALRKLPSHERAYAAERVVKDLAAALKFIREMRLEAIREMQALGLSTREIGELMDCTVDQVNGYISYAEAEERRRAARAAASEG